MRRLFACFFLLSTILLGCSKDSDNTISITGITERDEGGNLLGSEDSNDWSSDNNFPERVYDFFSFHKTMDYSTAEAASLELYAYPSPFETEFYFHVASTKKTVCRFVIVDESLKIYFVHEMMLNSGSTAIRLLASYFPRNKNLRIYYAFYDSSEVMYYKGHGDIRRK